MKKKIVTMMLMGMMAFSITACGSSGDSTPTEAQQESTNDAAPSEANSTENNT